ncbi:type II secretion system protein N [Oceanimonas doudoroffii]|uniref:Type II secretion system protein GspC N-terminal domain-containing protein n=1 Tax=Oceanimonas doudoroffii TaxID=84158 RepID=A0A233RB26_9GAMM|nr:type II secretion system protein N [Oceanimonas doudoroffii]OXY80590.1 hypothetical protein B6S08_16920 [Oceanimonas doudoroffii]
MKPFPWPMLFLLWLPPAQPDDVLGHEYPPLEQFASILERPLFKATRRPDSDNGAALTESAAEMRAHWRLSGVVWEDDQPLALFSERLGEGRLRVRAGMYVHGNWLLEEITKDGVLLLDNGQRLRLKLWEPRPPSTRPLPKPLASKDDAGGQSRSTETSDGEEPATEQGSNGESS